MTMRFLIIPFLWCLLSANLHGQTVNKVYPDDEGNIAWSVIIEDNGYTLAGAGYSDLFSGYISLKIMRVNDNGDLIYKRVYGKVGYGYYMGVAGSFIKTKSNDGYVSFGRVSDSNGKLSGLIVRYDQFGDTLWTKLYSGTRDNYLYNGLELPNGDLVAAGYTNSWGGNAGDFWVIKTDSSGNKKWEVNYGGQEYEECRYIINTPDGGFLLGGVTQSYGLGEQDSYIIKLDSAGNKLWDKTYGTPNTDWHALISNSVDGGFYIACQTDEPFIGGIRKNILMKTSSHGEIVWQTLIDSFYYSYFHRIQEVDTGRYVIIVGQKELDEPKNPGWILKIDSSGTKIWERFYVNPENNEDDGAGLRDFKIGDNGRIACSGFGLVTPGVNFGALQNFWLLVIDSNGCLVPDCDTTTGISNMVPPYEETKITVFPNPTHALTTVLLNQGPQNGEVSIEFYNLTGQQVQAKTHQLNSYGYGEWQIDCSGFSPGIYFYQVKSENGLVGKGKLVVE